MRNLFRREREAVSGHFVKEQGHDTQFMRRARSTDLFEEAAKGISGKRDRG